MGSENIFKMKKEQSCLCGYIRIIVSGSKENITLICSKHVALTLYAYIFMYVLGV